MTGSHRPLLTVHALAWQARLSAVLVPMVSPCPAAVLARMDFAQWFAEAVVACRYGEPRAVPVQVAHLEHYVATWSIDGVLTLSLADETFWQGPFGRGSFELVLHELAHHEAFHHGRSFPREVEAHAGAAAEVMLARADEARRLFPELLSASPGTAPATLAEPAYSDEISRCFRSKPAACSDRSQPGLPMIPAGWTARFASG